MKLFSFSERRRRAYHISRLAKDIARRAQSAVWQRAMPQLAFMGLAECRGYLRARAGGPIRQLTAVLIAEYGDADSEAVAEVGEQALDEVIHLVIRDMLKAAPVPAQQRRAA